MKEFMVKIEASIKNCFRKIIENSTSCIMSLLVIIIILQILNLKFGLEAYVHTINKIENRYNCVITALENGFNTEIDRYSGEKYKKPDIDKQVQRKKTHHKYLYHKIKDWF